MIMRDGYIVGNVKIKKEWRDNVDDDSDIDNVDWHDNNNCEDEESNGDTANWK